MRTTDFDGYAVSGASDSPGHWTDETIVWAEFISRHTGAQRAVRCTARDLRLFDAGKLTRVLRAALSGMRR